MIVVDLKYLTLSLEQHPDYKNILRRNGSPSGIDYIEKIIQIAYRVPCINDKGVMRSYVKDQIQIQDVDDFDETNPTDSNKKSNENEKSESNTNANQSQNNTAAVSGQSSVIPNSRNFEKTVSCNSFELEKLTEIFLLRVSILDVLNV